MPRRTDIRLVFQRRLKQAREQHQFSQKDLGIHAGLDPFVASTRINRYELGVHEPDMATIERLAHALSVPTAYLFADDDRMARLILAFDRLSAAEKERLLKAAEQPS
jgi:transcriptional regulator with XRE-family HTH domain